MKSHYILATLLVTLTTALPQPEYPLGENKYIMSGHHRAKGNLPKGGKVTYRELSPGITLANNIEYLEKCFSYKNCMENCKSGDFINVWVDENAPATFACWGNE